ncbi:gamma-tubulin ring complex protein [Irpex rosettiformis]|uniref:Gamma-tubulin ring complex protein n=1 Tax=Irpex rosettiformis TaxID=378272 RepID=A0ACB8UIS1_9APHY|nr:gamma-tubulin ring complex protein [Irpex rosettiformis]
MIAEVLLVLAGHSSSLFPNDHTVNPAFVPLLHPGEQQCLESLAQIAIRYRNVKAASHELSRSPSRYVSALAATLKKILKDEYENLVVETEAKVLKRDSSLVAGGSYVPISSLRATFAEWDAPLIALETLVEDLQTKQPWHPGPLIDILLARSNTGIHRIATIYTRLGEAVQRVWVTQLQAFMIHGSLSDRDGIAQPDYALTEGAMPGCVSASSRESISYVGRAVGTVKTAKWEKQFPRTAAMEYTRLLDGVLPQNQYDFDQVIAEIRTSVSEWLWLNVLTYKDVDEAVESLASYFLLRNGEFTLSLIREIERLKISRLTGRAGGSSMIREQDLHLALLRASLGTTAQYDPSLSRLRFKLPSGPLRPLLPSLAAAHSQKDVSSISLGATEITSFEDLLLGTPLVLTYTVKWPLDLFLHQTDLQVYAALFSYLSALRKTHTRIHTCWASISNAQRARRRWTGLGEGGTVEDLQVRRELLRCGWGVVREMTWFLDTILGYIMTDVVDVEFRRLKGLLLDKTGAVPLARQQTGGQLSKSTSSDGVIPTLSQSSTTATGLSASGVVNPQTSQLDFSTLRTIHTTYLERLVTGSLLSNVAITSIIRMILEVCERFVAQVERWGGDILPALLFEGSIATGGDRVGKMVEERRSIVAEINDSLNTLLESFYEQLSLSTTQQPFSTAGDASKSMLYSMTTTNASGFSTFVRPKKGKRLAGDEEVRRHVERLLLRLDFNGEFSTHRVGRRASHEGDGGEILKEGGLT